MPSLRQPLHLIAAALAIGLAADALFYGRAPGLSIALFVGLVLAVLAALARAEGHTPTSPNRWLGVGALLFAALVAVRASPLLITLNILTSLGLLLLHAALYRALPLARLDAWRVGVGAALAALESTVAPAPLAFQQARRLGRAGAHSRGLLVVGRGALLATPVLLLFTGLLALADSIFASYVSDILALRLPFDLAPLRNHALFVGCFAWAAAGGLLVALRDRPAGDLLGPPVVELPAEGETQRLRPVASLRFLGWGEAITVLALVDLLFGAFMLVQGAYLFGGLNTLDRTGMTFSNYARRGFFELVAVACLALGLLWALATVARRERPAQRRAFVAASGVMVALVLGLLASAALRMRLYEQAYGFTALRLLTYSWMAWLAIVLLLFLVALVRERPRWFSMGLPAAAAAYILALNLLNPDAMIVRENLARYHAGAELDVYYLTTLSADAAPTLAAALPELGEHRGQVAEHLRELRDELLVAADRDGLPGWNLGRMRAISAAPE
jgi:hypothetical protein